MRESNLTPDNQAENLRIDHDRLFKVLLTTFFQESIELLLPQVAAYTDFSTLKALDKEVFTDVTAGEKHEADIIMEVRFKPEVEGYLDGVCFLIHVENQSQSRSNFSKRMFIYFSRLYEKFDLDIYPIAIFSFDEPYRDEPHTHIIKFPDKTILDFDFEPIQLNKLDWHDFLNRPNPVASALMAKMKIAPEDRPKVKARCIAMLTGLELDEARNELITGFVDTYLDLNPSEEVIFQAELDTLLPQQQKEKAMEIVTNRDLRRRSEARIEGHTEGRTEGQIDLVLEILKIKIGSLDANLEKRVRALHEPAITQLGKALLNFNTPTDLAQWLDQPNQP